MAKDYVGLVQRKLREQTNPFFSTSRLRRLKRSDFSIISNNCWAGFVYSKFGLEYTTPTIGMGIVDDDYIKFLENMDY